MNLFEAVPNIVKEEFEGVNINDLTHFEYLKYITQIESRVWENISLTPNPFNRSQVALMIQNATNLLKENPENYDDLLG
tara:strand:- start:275 stop:511 length:237 start_codon:yes stop_codon:yes gene_type:complete